MKEELNALKDATIKIFKAKENFKKQKMFFNMKVEEQIDDLCIEEIFNADEDSYEAAKLLNSLFPQISMIISTLREQHPKYGNRRLKQLALEQIEVQDTIAAGEILDNYFLYENCGFSKLLEKEQAIEELEEEAKISSNAILMETKDSAIKAGNAIKDIVKPYGDVAKSQLEDAGKIAKSTVNKGSKKLIKILENIEKKTNK